MQVPLGKSLSSVISYLESKWATRQSEKHLRLIVPSVGPTATSDVNETTASKSIEMEVDCVGHLDKREWSKSSAGDLTVGDLYKSMECPKKFSLNYTWIDKKQVRKIERNSWAETEVSALKLSDPFLCLSVSLQICSDRHSVASF